MDDEKLIPELKEWRKYNKEFSIDDWIISEGNISFIIAYSKIFWPEFIEYDDCIIFKDYFSESNFENWKNTDYIKNYAQIESVLNHIHLLDLFGTDEKKDEINYDQILFLGNKLCEIYSAKLKVDYPEKTFVLSFNGDEKLIAFDEYEITFYQKRNLDRKLNKTTLIS